MDVSKFATKIEKQKINKALKTLTFLLTVTSVAMLYMVSRFPEGQLERIMTL